MPKLVKRIYSDSSIRWSRNKVRHRVNGPAVINVIGTRMWYTNGICDRKDGPAIVRKDGSLVWYLDGNRHRTDGPAVIAVNEGTLAYGWYIHGSQCVTFEQFKLLTDISDEELAIIVLKYGNTLL